MNITGTLEEKIANQFEFARSLPTETPTHRCSLPPDRTSFLEEKVSDPWLMSTQLLVVSKISEKNFFDKHAQEVFRAGFFFVSRLLASRMHEVGDLKKILSCSVSPPITRKSRKIDQKKTHWAREGCQKSCFRPRNAGIFSHFSWYFGLCFMFFCRFSACIACILTRLVRCVYNMDIQVCIMHDRCVYRYQKGICPHGQCVVRACRTFLSCSVYQKRASSRAQCVFFLDFFFENRRPHAEPPVSEKQKKARPYGWTQKTFGPEAKQSWVFRAFINAFDPKATIIRFFTSKHIRYIFGMGIWRGCWIPAVFENSAVHIVLDVKCPKPTEANNTKQYPANIRRTTTTRHLLIWFTSKSQLHKVCNALQGPSGVGVGYIEKCPFIYENFGLRGSLPISGDEQL